MVVLATWGVRTIVDRQATLERAKDQVEAMALLLEQHADRAFDTGDKVVQAIVELAGSTRFDDAASVERLHNQMRRLAAGSPQIASTWILGPTGGHVAESWAYPASATSNFAFREYFQTHLKGEAGLHIGTFGVGGDQQRPRFTLSRPIVRPDGSFGGVVVVAVLGEYFEKVYRMTDLGPGGYLCLVTESGALLAEWPQRNVNEREAAIPAAELKVERTLERFPARVVVSMSQDAALGGWRTRMMLTGGVSAAVILAFAGLTRMGLATGQREEKSRHKLQQANADLESRVRERTTALRQSETLLNRVLEHLPVGVGVFDASGRFILRNPVLEHLGLGFLPSLHSTDHAQWIGHGPDGQRLDRSQYPGARALRGEMVVPGVEFLHQTKDGNGAWRRVSAVPLDPLPGDGEAAAGIVVVEDIDQLKRSEEEVSARLDELRAVYDTAPIGMCVLDGEMRFQRINRHMAEMNGIPADDHIGRSVNGLLPEVADQAATIFRRVVETGQPVLNHEIVGETPSQPGAKRSWLESWVPLFGENGGIVGINVIAEETTERRQAERELRDAHLRLTSLLAAAGAGTFACELPGGAIHADASAAALFGLPAEIVEGASVEQVNAHIHPDDLRLVRARVRGVLRGGTTYRDEYRIVQPDGSIRWIAARGLVDNERVLHGAVFDVTALKQAQEAAVRREQQLRLVADAVPAMIAYLGPDQRFRFVNRAYCEWIGREPTQLLGHTIREIAEARTYAAMSPRIDAALRGESVRYEGPAPSPRRNNRTIEAHYLPYVDSGGAQDGFFLFILNVTEQKRREEELRDTTQRLRLLIDELNHRVKNTLATVQSIARQTLRRPDVPLDAREAIEARLLALGRSHELLSRETWSNVDLATLVHEALVAFGVDDTRAARFRLGGPKVRVPPNVALALGMAFHELATNAVKYGALSLPDGTVDLHWHLLSGRRLAVTWTEAGGPPVKPPIRRGFGTRLLEQGLAHALDGPVQMDYAAEGLRCHIELCLPSTEPRDA